ncbi:MAG: hypothetical protein ACYC3A_04470 [Halothiobacillus sp.]
MVTSGAAFVGTAELRRGRTVGGDLSPTRCPGRSAPLRALQWQKKIDSTLRPNLAVLSGFASLTHS